MHISQKHFLALKRGPLLLSPLDGTTPTKIDKKFNVRKLKNFNNLVNIKDTEILDPFLESSGLRDYCLSFENLILKIFLVNIVFSILVRAAE